MTPLLRKEQVLAALDAVIDPELHRSLVAAGMIQELRVDDGHVSFTLELTTPACPLRDTLRQAAEEAVRALPGVTEVTVNVTARVRAGRSGEELLRDVRNVIAVASGKGGVGKSTIAEALRAVAGKVAAQASVAAVLRGSCDR
jgi:ATP-binding protein involved in chromosome partitioning